MAEDLHRGGSGRSAVDELRALQTSARPTPATHPPAPRIEAPGAPAPAPRRRVVAVASLVLAAGAGWIGHALLAPAVGRIEPVTAAAAAASRADLSQERADLASQIQQASALVLATDGQVQDDAPRQALSTDLATAGALLEATKEIQPPTQARVEDGVVYLEPDARWDPGYATVTTRLQDATSELNRSHAAWAHSQLGDVLAAARDTLSASEAQVADPALRQSLSDAITTGQATWDAGAGDTALESIEARDAITTAQTAVEAARAQWVHAELSAAVEAARSVLDGSAGQVADNSVRDALFLALSNAQAVLDAGVGASTPTDTLAARDSLNAASSAVQAAITAVQQNPQT